MNATFVLDRSHSANFSLFPLPVPPPQPPPPKPFSPESLVRCSGCAPPGRTEPKQPVGRASFSHTVPLFSLLRRLSSGERHPPPIDPQNAQANSANPPEEATKHGEFSAAQSFRRKTAPSQLSEETGDATPAAGVTLYPCLFPPHCDAHSPPPTTSVTTAPTITTTAISPPQTLPTPSQIRLPAPFHSRNH